MKPAESAWNEFVVRLKDLAESWEALQKEITGLNALEREGLSIQGQRILAPATRKAKFLIALPRILDTIRRNGGIEALVITDYEEEEDDDDD